MIHWVQGSLAEESAFSLSPAFSNLHAPLRKSKIFLTAAAAIVSGTYGNLFFALHRIASNPITSPKGKVASLNDEIPTEQTNNSTRPLSQPSAQSPTTISFCPARIPAGRSGGTLLAFAAPAPGRANSERIHSIHPSNSTKPHRPGPGDEMRVQSQDLKIITPSQCCCCWAAAFYNTCFCCSSGFRTPPQASAELQTCSTITRHNHTTTGSPFVFS